MENANSNASPNKSLHHQEIVNAMMDMISSTMNLDVWRSLFTNAHKGRHCGMVHAYVHKDILSWIISASARRLR